jgi:glycosyltransferase involved in cell wall biosynthesis
VTRPAVTHLEHGTAPVAHVLAPAMFGGLERVVASLAAGQAAAGRSVTVMPILPPGGEDHPFLAELDPAVNVSVVRVPDRAYRAERRAVARMCGELGIRILHTHGARVDVVDSGAARAAGIPSVTTVHGFCGGGLKNRFYEWLQRRSFRSMDAVVAVSRKLATDLVASGVDGRVIHTIPNGFDGAVAPVSREEARRRLGLGEGEVCIGWVGRLSPEKGPDILLDALGSLRDLPWRLSVLGQGRLRSPLEEQARRLGIDHRITWHGGVAGAPTLYRAFDLFVLSSRTEGTPMVLLEAMAAGVPVVATAVGGVPDVVDSRHALVVPPEQPRALAEAIRSALVDREAALIRAAAAAARLEAEYGRDAWVAGYDRVYEAVLRSPAARYPAVTRE